ncbi:hypothetical protein ACFYNZ_27245 [Streptomyces kebangsaanensis]|uniref:Uncharacterized protein n=1 Tax=Streptomyces kebangsaanensis TaxID=864058 RepID=A0ABW6KZ09_9ACTN
MLEETVGVPLPVRTRNDPDPRMMTAWSPLMTIGAVTAGSSALSVQTQCRDRVRVPLAEVLSASVMASYKAAWPHPTLYAAAEAEEAGTVEGRRGDRACAGHPGGADEELTGEHVTPSEVAFAAGA